MSSSFDIGCRDGMEKMSSRLRNAMSFTEDTLASGHKILNMHHGDKVVGRIAMKKNIPGAIQGAEILDDRYKNMGLGKKMYGEAARRFGADGVNGKLSIHSDGSVSPDAQRLWRSLAKDPKREVKTHDLSSTRQTAQGPKQSWDYDKIEAAGVHVPNHGLFSASYPAKAKIASFSFPRFIGNTALGGTLGAASAVGSGELLRLASGSKMTKSERKKARSALAVAGLMAGAGMAKPRYTNAFMENMSPRFVAGASLAVPALAIGLLAASLKLDSMRKNPSFTRPSK